MVRLYTREELMAKFGWEEYVIFSLMLAVSTGIGIFFWCQGRIRAKRADPDQAQGNAEFLLGGKSVGTFPVTLSLIASFLSAITLLGTPAEMYANGTQYIILIFSYPMVMAAAAYVYLPVFYKLECSTSYEYLEWRFNRFLRVLASTCFTLEMTLYMALVVYTPALAVSQVTGFNVDLGCVVMFLVCIFYTSIGGIKAVMWTDVFQTVVMFGAFLVIIIKGSNDVGGTSKVFEINYENNRIELFNFSPDPTVRHTVWGMVIGGFFTWLNVYACNQTQVQRYLTVPKVQMAVKAIWWNLPGLSALLIICAYGGLVIFAYYRDIGCDPISSGMVKTKDQLFPLFVMQVMGDIPCIPGLFIAGVFSGALSTVSSGLNSLAAVTLQDFIVGGCNVKMSDRVSAWVSKGLAVGYGLLSFLLVFVVKYLPGVLEAALAIRGMLGGPVLGAFTLGMLCPWANQFGASLGTLCALAVSFWIGFGQQMARNLGHYKLAPLPATTEACPNQVWNDLNATLVQTPTHQDESGFTHLPVYEISYIWLSMIGFVVCIVVGLVTSLANPQDPRKLNPDLISPVVHSLFKSKGFHPAIQKRIDSIEIGIEHTPSKKELRLKRSQISMASAMPSSADLVRSEVSAEDDGEGLHFEARNAIPPAPPAVVNGVLKKSTLAKQRSVSTSAIYTISLSDTGEEAMDNKRLRWHDGFVKEAGKTEDNAQKELTMT